MPFKLKRCPEYGVTFMMFSGELGVNDVVKLYGLLDYRDCCRWLSYWDPFVTVTGLDDRDTLSNLKKFVVERQGEIFRGLHPPNAMVYTSQAGEEFARFWQRYTLMGDAHPLTPAVFADLKAACGWLGLPEEALAVLEAEIRQFEAEVQSPGPEASDRRSP